MADIDLTKSELPFLLSGNRTLTVHRSVPQLDQPLVPSDTDLREADCGAAGDQAFTFGAADTVRLTISADREPALRTLADKRPRPAEDFGRVLAMGFLLHASRSSRACAGPQCQRLGISFEYGSQLKVVAGLSVGYQLSGSPSFKVGQLQLSEHYDLSVIGKLGLNAQVAGNCQVELRSPGKTHATGTNWARVIVVKSCSNAFRIAADVNVGAGSDLQALTDTGEEWSVSLSCRRREFPSAPGPT